MEWALKIRHRIAVDLVMPMAGVDGSFSEAGFTRPKPLFRLDTMPLFWWAANSVLDSFDVRRMVCVVLQAHVERHRIDRLIRERFSNAEIVILAYPTASAVETVMQGCATLEPHRWLLVNDCDHAFDGARAAHCFASHVADADAFGCHPVADPTASAGLYGFRDRNLFAAHAEAATAAAVRTPVRMRDVLDRVGLASGALRALALDRYVPFGTPDEYDAAADAIRTLQRRPLNACAA